MNDKRDETPSIFNALSDVELADAIWAGDKYTHTFTVTGAGPSAHLSGQFNVKIPDAADTNHINVRRAALRQGQPVEAFSANDLVLQEIVATLGVVVTKGPTWFFRKDTDRLVPAPELVRDLALLGNIFSEYVEWSDRFFRGSDGQDGGDRGASDQPTPVATGEGAQPAPVPGGGAS